MIKIGIVRGLAAINKKIADDEERRSGGDGPKTKWFKLEDKQSVKVIFLQEMDEESPNYSEKNGLGVVAVEHSSPLDFKRKALCTRDDNTGERCWACEKHRASYREEGDDYKGGWKPKSRLYINVLIDNGTDEPYVAVLSQGLSDKQISPALFEFAGEYGTITDREYRIKRSGAGFNDTSYLLTPLAERSNNVEEYELFDIEGSVLRNVPFEQQEAHYLSGSPEASSETTRVFAGAGSATTSTTDSDEW